MTKILALMITFLLPAIAFSYGEGKSGTTKVTFKGPISDHKNEARGLQFACSKAKGEAQTKSKKICDKYGGMDMKRTVLPLRCKPEPRKKGKNYVATYTVKYVCRSKKQIKK